MKLFQSQFLVGFAQISMWHQIYGNPNQFGLILLINTYLTNWTKIKKMGTLKKLPGHISMTRVIEVGGCRVDGQPDRDILARLD
jgi:hypothetical protein